MDYMDCGMQMASECETTMMTGCDVDVQFHVNRVCAGRQYCSLHVGISTFVADPCSEHNEFLVVSYNCLPGTDSSTYLLDYTNHPRITGCAVAPALY